MIQRSTAWGMRIFFLAWFGQLVSLLGSGLTSFALGVWVYQRTGSAMQLGLVYLFTFLPGIIISPLAGALIDRMDRRLVLILSDCGSALSVLFVALMFATNQLEPWHIYLATGVSSLFNTLQWPAFAASVALLVPKQHLGRANGMMQLGPALGQIVAPFLAGLLIALIRVEGVILVDFATFLFAIVMLLLVRFPRPEITTEGAASKGSLRHEVAYSWNYIVARRGLLSLLIFFALINFSVGFIDVLITPLVLSFANVTELGLILSIGGSGMVIGSILMSLWGGPQRRIYGVLGFSLLLGAAMFIGGLRPSVPLIACAAFMFLFSSTFINGCSQAIWQSKVAPDLQGRVLAMEQMFSMATLPLAYLIAGPLADNLFKPLLTDQGPLRGSIGQLIGTGPGRGIGLLFSVLGLVIVLTVVAGYLYRPLREVDYELTDAISEPIAETAKSPEIGSPAL